MPLRIIDNPNLARNPVARQVALANMRSRLLTERVRAYFLNDGEYVEPFLTTYMHLFVMIESALFHERRTDHPAMRVIRGAAGACVQMAEDKFLWRPRHAGALDSGLMHAMLAYPSLGRESIARAWLEIGPPPGMK